MQFGTAEELIAISHNSNDGPPQSPQRAFKGGDCKRHHCRKCGQAVCAECSKTRQPVPERGWLDDVRVCDTCVNDMAANTAPSAGASSTTTPSYDSSSSHSKPFLLDDSKTKVE